MGEISKEVVEHRKAGAGLHDLYGALGILLLEGERNTERVRQRRIGFWLRAGEATFKLGRPITDAPEHVDMDNRRGLWMEGWRDAKARSDITNPPRYRPGHTRFYCATCSGPFSATTQNHTKGDTMNAKQQGYAANRAGAAIADNPYNKHEPTNRREWNDGWYEADDETPKDRALKNLDAVFVDAGAAKGLANRLIDTPLCEVLNVLVNNNIEVSFTYKGNNA